MGLTIGAVAAVLCGLGMTVAAAYSGVQRRRFRRVARRAEGTIVEMAKAGSGEWPVVTFDAEGKVVRFRSNFRRSDHRVGGRVQVLYDPAHVDGATMVENFELRGYVAGFGAGGLALLGIGIFMAVYLAPMNAACNRAAEDFLGAVRAGDTAAVGELTAPGERLDEALLRGPVRASRDFDSDSGSLGIDTGCVNGKLDSGTYVYIRLRRVEGAWKVARIATADPDCESDGD